MRKLDDPIFMEISWSRIISFVDESAAALVRTAFSPIIREAEDYAVVLFDGNGNSLAQSTTSAPSFIGTLPKTIRHFMEAIMLISSRVEVSTCCIREICHWRSIKTP